MNIFFCIFLNVIFLPIISSGTGNITFSAGNITSSAIVSLMQKYSNSSEFITDIQFQNFLDKIHSCNRTVNKTFSDQTKRLEHCFSADKIFHLLNIKDGMLDITGFMLLCPVVLQTIDTGICSADLLNSNVKSFETSKRTTSEAWIFGFLFVTLISLCSLIGVSVVPLMKKEFYNQMLMALVGLAVGSLSSSAIFHLIPQAYGIVNKDAQHEYLTNSLMMVAGIWVFFLIERILNCISIFRSKRILNHTDHKDAAIGVSTNTTNCAEDIKFLDLQEISVKEQECYKNSHDHVMNFEDDTSNSIATVAWMIIFGDGFHNFIDGLSIGAAFSENLLTGFSISLAVLCEELPHELGDIAVLLNSGMRMKQALMYNFLSACTCYFGLILGILLGEIEASTYIFGLAGGMFLYISLADMVPKMNEMAEEASHISIKKAVYILFLQNLGIGIGVISLFILARYQSYFDFE